MRENAISAIFEHLTLRATDLMKNKTFETLTSLIIDLWEIHKENEESHGIFSKLQKPLEKAISVADLQREVLKIDRLLTFAAAMNMTGEPSMLLWQLLYHDFMIHLHNNAVDIT